MVANRRICGITLLIVFGFISSAQEVRKSFDFKEEKRSKILQQVVEQYGFYLSYKPDIFRDDPVLTLRFEDRPMADVMDTILGANYTYRKIDDYVVVTPVSASSPKAPQESPEIQNEIMYDTVVVEKEVVRYDTQRVVLTEIVYDTIPIRKAIYDTVKVEARRTGSEKQLTHGPYLTPLFQQFGNGSAMDLYSGGAIGWIVKRKVSKVQLQLSGEYVYLQSRLNFSESFVRQEQQIDTIAQFFIIENGVPIPVYVTDTTFVDKTIERIFDRTNSRSLINFTIDIGHDFEWKKMTLGAYVGVVTSLAVRSDELRKSGNTNSMEISTIRLSSPSFNIQLQLPLYFPVDAARSKAYLAPVASFSIHDVTDQDAVSISQISYGVRLGWFF